MEDCFIAECSIKNGITSEEVNAKFKETIFDRMDNKNDNSFSILLLYFSYHFYII